MCLRERLVLAEDADPAELAAYQRWARYGWEEAYSYHTATRSYPFVELSSPSAGIVDGERMREYSRQAPPPAIYQHVPASRTVPLARVDLSDDVDAALARLAPEQSRGVDGIGYLFDLCFGERGKVHFPDQGLFLLKSIPSGGARHTTEVFLLGFQGCPVGTGAFHYDAEGHALECFDTRDARDEAREATSGLFDERSGPPLALVIFTALFERAMWRYRDPRSWRAVLADVGHAVALFRVVSRRLGWGHHTCQTFCDSAISRLLRLEPLRQAPLLVATLE